MDPQIFKSVLKTAMDLKLIEAHELAEKSGVSESFISRLLNGERGASLSTYGKLEKGLGEEEGFFFRLKRTCTSIK